MRSTQTMPALVLASVAILFGAPVAPCSAAALSLAVEKPPAVASGASAAVRAPGRARAGSLPAAGVPAAPTFQVVGAFGDMTVLNPTNMLTPAVFVQVDSAFGANAVTGLAISPGGTAFIVGNDSTGNSWLGQVNFNTGAETTVGKITGYVINDIAFDGAGHLYGLTDSVAGASPHSLLLINTATAATVVVIMLDNHGGPNDLAEAGAIAFNPADSNFYYADRNSTGQLFVDKYAPGSFTQTAVVTTSTAASPTAMAFSQGRLWLFSFGTVYSADASNIAAGFTNSGQPAFATADGFFAFLTDGAVANTLSCVPSPTAACLYNRFKIEITYDATPNNGTGAASVVLESAASVKFTFFDPTNIEMILKILNACGLNNKWWVFAGGLTNVGVSIKVTDTATGVARSYGSTKGHLFETFADTSAFGCP
jgi:hypothetical protein